MELRGPVPKGPLWGQLHKQPTLFLIELVSSGYLAMRVLKVRDIFWVDPKNSLDSRPASLLSR
ncbi:MAG: hypothetical protein A3F82_11135 [Deltaproteobacteria bacterium RIFCSPLOWO2_12_FULL_44_12]|nr:MAG: hypothetical protein A2712_09135 [Deltaproteobacteria bacterium RIFCSPHIGHO2_01_FULL_43_49]OGQ14505.1 MAG: hypothetical protein A3D22_07865 [Deltaproteobacteria bacterium RIFCSPHIGHO2_02_FULL_44_53]OGQ27891.1 MAG: hypothetical protein A3D98_06575 [Deltaproteobacteria bacterium RIFCSPHIGHO2_12_FULL_44_21]OGQ31103.1 MAG: hypothetical protein A2979_06625 [Deltaproteobacteria bacterium RIFCSPLOWO2_01_FULL_45_74]OGQ43094.1 MAG: hypothetical protein A3I70_00280 [Deltaproteobacteria bacterium 